MIIFMIIKTDLLHLVADYSIIIYFQQSFSHPPHHSMNPLLLLFILQQSSYALSDDLPLSIP